MLHSLSDYLAAIVLEFGNLYGRREITFGNFFCKRHWLSWLTRVSPNLIKKQHYFMYQLKKTLITGLKISEVATNLLKTRNQKLKPLNKYEGIVEEV